MSVKQDRSYARTAQDIERKYSFGKTFADMLGLVNENRDKVDLVESTLRDEIKEQSTTLKRDTEQIVLQAKKELTQSISATETDLNNSISAVDNRVTELSSEVSLKVDTEQIVLQAKKELTQSISATETDLNNSISAVDNRVTDTETNLNNSISAVDNRVTVLSSEVSLKLDSEAVKIEIEKELANGVDRVATKMGYTFDDNGLDISKSGEEMRNKLDNTGMYVTKDGNEILTANNRGVNATNLHANTYLIIGSGNGRSRFEDYGTDRTACFWIGG